MTVVRVNITFWVSEQVALKFNFRRLIVEKLSLGGVRTIDAASGSTNPKHSPGTNMINTTPLKHKNT